MDHIPGDDVCDFRFKKLLDYHRVIRDMGQAIYPDFLYDLAVKVNLQVNHSKIMKNFHSYSSFYLQCITVTKESGIKESDINFLNDFSCGVSPLPLKLEHWNDYSYQGIY